MCIPANDLALFILLLRSLHKINTIVSDSTIDRLDCDGILLYCSSIKKLIFSNQFVFDLGLNR